MASENDILCIQLPNLKAYYQILFHRYDVHEVYQYFLCNHFHNEENVFIDGTHIKASANNKKSISKFVEVSAKFYEKYLQEKISKDREINKKKL